MSQAAAAAVSAGQVRVRTAQPDDMPDVLRMIHELAQYEGMPDGPELTVEDLVADGFGSSPWFFCVVAERAGVAGVAGGAGGAGGPLLGHMLCNRAYSSWTRRALYLEDLYVRPEARRLGVATLLLEYLCQMAVREGVHRVDWHVMEDNAPALAFYSRLGARDLRASEGRAALRLDRPRIDLVAAGGLRRPASPARPPQPAHPAQRD